MRIVLLCLVMCGHVFCADDKPPTDNPNPSEQNKPSGIFGEFVLRKNERVIGMYNPESGTLTRYEPSETKPIKDYDIMSLRRLDAEPEATPTSLIAAQERSTTLSHIIIKKQTEHRDHQVLLTKIYKEIQQIHTTLAERDAEARKACEDLNEAKTSADKITHANTYTTCIKSIDALHATHAELNVTRAAVEARLRAIVAELDDLHQRQGWVFGKAKELSPP